MRTVRPSPTWQDSLIRLSKGQRVVIDVEEVWSPDMRDQIVWCGADGVYNHIAGADYLLPGTNVGALIARIGEYPVFETIVLEDREANEEAAILGYILFFMGFCSWKGRLLYLEDVFIKAEVPVKTCMYSPSGG